MAGIATPGERIRVFLHYCRTEKGLAANSLEAYRRDLAQLAGWLRQTALVSVSLNTLRSYLDYLREKRLSNRSIARQVAAIRSFFGFLLEEGDIPSNPADLLAAPQIGTNLPK